MAKCRGVIPVRSVFLREKRDSSYYYWVLSPNALKYYGCSGYGDFLIKGRIMKRISPSSFPEEMLLHGKNFRGLYLFSERDVILRDERSKVDALERFECAASQRVDAGGFKGI